VVATVDLVRGEISNLAEWECLCLMGSDAPADVNDQGNLRAKGASGLCPARLGLDFLPKLLPSFTERLVFT